MRSTLQLKQQLEKLPDDDIKVRLNVQLNVFAEIVLDGYNAYVLKKVLKNGCT